jgi:hypothetical protein
MYIQLYVCVVVSFQPFMLNWHHMPLHLYFVLEYCKSPISYLILLYAIFIYLFVLIEMVTVSLHMK